MSNTTKFHGCPGTGKTRKALEELTKAAASGVPVDQIMYNTYRRFAADEAISKIVTTAKIPKNKMQNINTTHGICNRLLKETGYVSNNKTDNPVMDYYDYMNFNKEMKYGIKPGKTINISDRFIVHKDPYLTFATVASSMRLTPKQAIQQPFFRDLHLNPEQALQFLKDYKYWKREHNKIDFNDMAEVVLKKKIAPDCRIQIYDEFQDSTTLLHDLAQMWAKSADQVFLAGDPLQTIYTHLGASPEYFLNWEGETKTLQESYRLPANVWNIAGTVIAENTPYTVPEDVKTKEGNGVVGKINFRRLPPWLLSHPLPKSMSVYHLVRTNEIGFKVANMLADVGIPFTGITGLAWGLKDIDLYNTVHTVRHNGILSSPELQLLQKYYPTIPFTPGSSKVTPQLSSLLKSSKPFQGSTLKGFTMKKLQGAINAKLPRLTSDILTITQILTIHGAKGLESDIVFLHNATSPKISLSVYESARGRMNEAMIWYVGITRARKALYGIEHDSNNTYPLIGEWK